MNLEELLRNANTMGMECCSDLTKELLIQEFEEWLHSDEIQTQLKNIAVLDGVNVTPNQLLKVAGDIKLKLYKGETSTDEQFEYLKDVEAIERVVKMLKPDNSR